MTKRVLITGARAPVAVEMSLLFSRIGAEVHVADSTPMLFAAGLKCIAAGHKLPAARNDPAAYGAAVADLVRRLGVYLVVPTCEEVFYLAAARDAGHGIPLLAPPLATLRHLHDKLGFIELAKELGLAVPETTLLSSRSDLDALAGRSHDLVFKPCFSRFAVETKVGVAADKLKKVQPTPEMPWIAQERLRGEEFCTYAVALHGRLAAFSVYRPLYRLGQASSYYFEPVELPEAQRFTEAVAAATGFHGQIAFDMIRTPDRGLLPLECNPRATSGLHLLSDRPDLARRMLAGKSNGEVLRPTPGGAPATATSVMWLFGLLPAIIEGRVGRWRSDKRRARDIFAVPGNSLHLRAWRVLGSYCAEALRTWQPIRVVTAADIEWNGEPLDVGR